MDNTQVNNEKNHHAGIQENLSGAEAVAKIRELAEGKICFFGTYKGDTGLDARPMYTHKVDDDGSVWFMNLLTTKADQQLLDNPAVDLLYAYTGDDKYLHLKGRARILKDKAKIDEFWSEIVKTWVPNGKEDPDLVVIKVEPYDVYYWDTQHGKLVQYAKIAISTVTGATMDDGREGHLRV